MFSPAPARVALVRHGIGPEGRRAGVRARVAARSARGARDRAARRARARSRRRRARRRPTRPAARAAPPPSARWTRCRCSWPRSGATGCSRAAEEVALAKSIERGDLAAKERLVNSNLRLVISNARSYEGLDLPLLDLIQEGMLGLDPRRREVRLAQGLQVLHLRDVLDPRVDPAGDRQPGPADPGAGPHRPARAAHRARPGQRSSPSWAASRPTRRSPRRPSSSSARCSPPGTSPAW